MPVRDILIDPHPLLRRCARPITPAELRGAATQRLIDDMLDTVAANKLIGMAAPQIGIGQRLFVIDFEDQAGRHGPLAMANPAISHQTGALDWAEASPCCPGRGGMVRRAARLRCRGLGRDGKPYTIKAQGLFAVCIQHQVDHLDGILYLDRVMIPDAIL